MRGGTRTCDSVCCTNAFQTAAFSSFPHQCHPPSRRHRLKRIQEVNTERCYSFLFDVPCTAWQNGWFDGLTLLCLVSLHFLCDIPSSHTVQYIQYSPSTHQEYVVRVHHLKTSSISFDAAGESLARRQHRLTIRWPYLIFLVNRLYFVSLDCYCPGARFRR